VTEESVSTTSKHRKPWYRRRWLAVPAVFLLAIVIVGGVMAVRIQRTFSTLNQVSTPDTSISGEALGGDPSLKIDTGPAKTALAQQGQPTQIPTEIPTETPPPAPTQTPSSEEGVEQATEEVFPATDVPDQATERPAKPPASATAEATSAPIEAVTQTISAPSSPTAPSSFAPTETWSAGPQPTIQATPAGRSSETPSTSPATAPVSQGAAISSPSATPSSTATLTPTATATPSPTPTPILSDIERVNDKSFENNDGTWDLESGAAIVETAAVDGTHALELPGKGTYAGQSVYSLVGTTYQLSGWGKVAQEGESAEIGLAYFDENGNRLDDLEPSPLTFTSTSYQQLVTSITIPEGVASTNVYVFKGSGDGAFYADALSFRSEVGETEIPAASNVDDNAINILIMGVDARPGEAIDIGVRPDSLMVLRLDPDTRSCRVLGIPRDTRTELPGYGQSKINHALAVGGIPYEQQVVENLLGLTIDHYVLIDFDGFEEMVNAVGGVTINVPETFSIVGESVITYEAGEHTLNGAQALNYARYRGGPDGDFGRIQRQQQILRGLINKTSGLNVVKSINELLPAVADNLRTDLSATEMTDIALDYRSICTESSIEFFRLDGYNAWFDDPILQLRLIYVVVDEAEIRSKVAMLLGK
jgi:LCP family protein required for cell wall assembly